MKTLNLFEKSSFPMLLTYFPDLKAGNGLATFVHNEPVQVGDGFQYKSYFVIDEILDAREARGNYPEPCTHFTVRLKSAPFPAATTKPFR